VDGLEFETVPAYNILKPFHPKQAEWVGYILQIGGKRIYVAGDTDATKEAKSVSCDVALIPIGGTYTMDVKNAAELANILQPDVVIPTHYGCIVGNPEDGEAFAKLVKAPVKVELKIRF
jgi:L-ascorbate metabolism protein UlaG (beta-lactamase superfamily)